MKKSEFDHQILLLQGGGALGAYQAGAYEGLVEAGIVPDWVVGISIGAINAALIVGNPPGRRVERLREFWNRVSGHAPLIPPTWLDPMRPALNRLSSSASVMYGAPGFFSPRVPPPPLFTADGNPEAVSFYDTEPLKGTLEELVDFDLINRHNVRLSLGVVNVSTGKSIYFDNQKTQIGPDHVRASGALPPGFPPVVIEGEHYWDGGILCNSPILYMLDDLPRMSALVVQVDIFMAEGELPRNIDDVLRREKDIRLASKTLFNIAHLRDLLEKRDALKDLLAKLPASLKDDPAVRKLAPLCDMGEMTIARLVNRGLSHAGHTKGYDFSRATVNELWAAGLDDVRHSVAMIESMHPRELGSSIRAYDLPYGDTSAPMPESNVEPEQKSKLPPHRPRVSRVRRLRASHLRRMQPKHVRSQRRGNRHQASH